MVGRINGVRVAYVDHNPFPFQPAFASSIRPSSPLAKNPSGYGTRSTTHLPFTSASSASSPLPVAIGTFRPSPNVSN